jgi:tetratricopeptide (TPR) repeat protein
MAYVQRRQGKWDDAVRNLERAMEIDPTSVERIENLVQALVYMRRWDDAARLNQQGLDSDPTSVALQMYRALLKLATEGDASGAAAILESITPRAGYVADFVAQCYILARDYDGVHRALPSLGAYPSTDTTSYYISRSTAYHFAGDREKAHAFADSARMYIEARGFQKSDVAPWVAGYGATLAALGRGAEGLRYGNKAVEMLPVEKDAVAGAEIRATRMVIYLTIKDYEAAIREIQFLMSIPSNLSPVILRLHPGFDAIRDDPRFKKLAEEKISS